MNADAINKRFVVDLGGPVVTLTAHQSHVGSNILPTPVLMIMSPHQFDESGYAPAQSIEVYSEAALTKLRDLLNYVFPPQ